MSLNFKHKKLLPSLSLESYLSPNYDLQNNKKYRIYKAYGIACFKKVPGKPLQLLLVKRRHSYSYVKFLTALRLDHYDQIIETFAGLFSEERVILSSCNFDLIWKYIYYDQSHLSMQRYYEDSKNRFESLFLSDGGYKLKNMLSAASDEKSSLGDQWEIPKGKKKSDNESDINCALREFVEETSISIDNIEINSGKYYSIQYECGDKIFKMCYYVALMKSTEEIPRMDYINDDLTAEVIDVRWFCKEQCAAAFDEPLAAFIKKLFKVAKKAAAFRS